MRHSRNSYFRLAQLLGDMTIVPALALEDAERSVLNSFLSALERGQGESGFAGVAPAE
jgi:hypothetical protein